MGSDAVEIFYQPNNLAINHRFNLINHTKALKNRR